MTGDKDKLGGGNDVQPTIAEAALAKLLHGKRDTLGLKEEGMTRSETELTAMEESIAKLTEDLSAFDLSKTGGLKEFHKKFPEFILQLEALIAQSDFPDALEPIAFDQLHSVRVEFVKLDEQYKSVDTQAETLRGLEGDESAAGFKQELLRSVDFRDAVRTPAESALNKSNQLLTNLAESVSQEREAVQANLLKVRELLGVTIPFDVNLTPDVTISSDDLDGRKDRFTRALISKMYLGGDRRRTLDEKIHQIRRRWGEDGPAAYRVGLEEGKLDGNALRELAKDEETYASLLNLLAHLESVPATTANSSIDRLQEEMDEDEFASLLTRSEFPNISSFSSGMSEISHIAARDEHSTPWKLITKNNGEGGESSYFHVTNDKTINRAKLVEDLRIQIAKHRIIILNKISSMAIIRDHYEQNRSFNSEVSTPMTRTIFEYLSLLGACKHFEAMDVETLGGVGEDTIVFEKEFSMRNKTFGEALATIANLDPVLYTEMQALAHVGNAQNVDMNSSRDFKSAQSQAAIPVNAHGVHFDPEHEKLTIEKFHEFVALYREATESHKTVSHEGNLTSPLWVTDNEAAGATMRHIRTKALRSITDLSRTGVALRKERDELQSDLEEANSTLETRNGEIEGIRRGLQLVVKALRAPRGWGKGKTPTDYWKIADALAMIEKGTPIDEENIGGKTWPKK